jgi:MFS family permease
LLPLIVLSIAGWAVIAPAYGFFSYVATTRHGWTPAQVSVAIVLAGGVGTLGWPIGGRLADTIGRRLTASLGLIAISIAVATIFAGPATFVSPAFCLLVFAEAWVTTAAAALASECFPTAMRSSAKAVITNAQIVGGMLGLGAVGALAASVGGAGRVITALPVLNVVALALLWTLPETAGSDLDALEAA